MLAGSPVVGIDTKVISPTFGFLCQVAAVLHSEHRRLDTGTVQRALYILFQSFLLVFSEFYRKKEQHNVES